MHIKTLIINGSPRRNGGTATLVNMLKAELRGDITVIETYYADISPCVDCRVCWSEPFCAIDDGMHKAYRAIDESDNIVIASPIYFAELTGSLLQWASRLQFIWTAKNMRGQPYLADKPRKGAVMLADGGDGYYETAMAMGKRLLRVMGAEFVGSVYFSGTDKLGATLPNVNEKAQAEVAALALNLNCNNSNNEDLAKL